MKAYVLHAINDLRYEETSFPDCPKDWAIVKVKAAGICSSDVSRVFTNGTYNFPTIPGHEFSGEVFAVGDQKNESYVGKRVGIFPLIPCMNCPQCREKHYEMCERYDYVGSRRNGGFAEYVAVPIWNLVEIPNDVPFSVAAMMEPISVALHAIKRGGIKKGVNVAIIGTGMIGISAGQWAKALEAGSVTVIGRNQAKRDITEKSGLHYLICINKKDIGQYDFVLEAVGTPSSIELAISAAKPGGTVVLMGNPSKEISLSQDIYWRILRKQLTIIGTWNSSYDGVNLSDWTESINAISNKQLIIDPLISHIYPQERLMDGLLLMSNHQEPYCKVLTIWNEN